MHFYVAIAFVAKTAVEWIVIANDLPNDNDYYSTYDTLRNNWNTRHTTHFSIGQRTYRQWYHIDRFLIDSYFRLVNRISDGSYLQNPFPDTAEILLASKPTTRRAYRTPHKPQYTRSAEIHPTAFVIFVQVFRNSLILFDIVI